MPTPDSAMVGEVRFWARVAAGMPDGWLPCDGSVYLIEDYSMLFSIISNYYGGDGRTYFATPNLCERTVGGVGHTSSDSAFYFAQPLGRAQAGYDLPKHSHPTDYVADGKLNVYATTAIATQDEPAYYMPAQGQSKVGLTTIPHKQFIDTAEAGVITPINGLVLEQSSAEGQTEKTGAQFPAGRENRQPSLTLGYYICAYAGEYPQRG